MVKNATKQTLLDTLSNTVTLQSESAGAPGTETETNIGFQLNNCAGVSETSFCLSYGLSVFIFHYHLPLKPAKQKVHNGRKGGHNFLLWLYYVAGSIGLVMIRMYHIKSTEVKSVLFLQPIITCKCSNALKTEGKNSLKQPFFLLALTMNSHTTLKETAQRPPVFPHCLLCGFLRLSLGGKG